MRHHLFYRPEADLLLTLGDAQALHPEVRPNTDDSALAAVGLHRLVADGPPPPVGRHEVLIELQPDLVDGQYMRRYSVVPMFPCDTHDGDGLVTVAAQMARFDAGRLAEAKLAALAGVDVGLADALAAGLQMSCGAVVDLDHGAALLRHETSVSYFGADTMPLFVRGGVMELESAEFCGVAADAARCRVALHLHCAELRARIQEVQTDEALQRLDLLVRA
jgi:hypothetical protein